MTIINCTCRNTELQPHKQALRWGPRCPNVPKLLPYSWQHRFRLYAITSFGTTENHLARIKKYMSQQLPTPQGMHTLNISRPTHDFVLPLSVQRIATAFFQVDVYRTVTPVTYSPSLGERKLMPSCGEATHQI
jgi:hypothetical protein